LEEDLFAGHHSAIIDENQLNIYFDWAESQGDDFSLALLLESCPGAKIGQLYLHFKHEKDYLARTNSYVSILAITFKSVAIFYFLFD
jgi:hypothetical protein